MSSSIPLPIPLILLLLVLSHPHTAVKSFVVPFVSSPIAKNFVLKCANFVDANVSGNAERRVLEERSWLKSSSKSSSSNVHDNVAEFWGKRPVLFRQAFPPGEDSWASYEDVVELASDEDVEVRLIRCPPHLPSPSSSPSLDRLDLYDVEVGPFDASYVSEVLKSSSSPFSFLLNDVDRFLPSLADWMNTHFSFVPNWRRDDGQVSLSSNGGGIDLHVDDYDVFLVQTEGERSWTVEFEAMGMSEELDRRWVRGIGGEA
jgi:hypothetical protein